MIVAGALDQYNEAWLATRLGLSGRHLRRLFVAQLGVTPDGLARSCRAHFARRLLDDTDIPITEIAYMAGFGSVRQFNRDCQVIFRATPSQLRAGHAGGSRHAPDGGLTLRLWFTGQLDWQALISFLAARAMPGVEDVGDRAYRRTIVVGGDPGVLELRPGGRDHLLLRVHLPHWEGLIHLTSRARGIAGLDDDIVEPVHWLSADPVVGQLLSARPGVRIPGSWDPFEIGIAAIASQEPPRGGTHAFLARLVQRFGTSVPGLDRFRLTHVFPRPGDLADASTDLEEMGMPADQADMFTSFAAAVEQGTLRLDRSLSCDELIMTIRAIPGVTPSTAQYIALRMGHPDAFPADDPVLQQALGSIGGRHSSAQTQQWHPWRSHIAAHLWAAA